MPSLSTETFKKRLSKRHPQITVLGEYISAKDKIKCRCKICSNTWDTSTPDNLLRRCKYGCPNCHKIAQNLKWQSEIRVWLRKRRPDIVLDGELKTARSKTWFKCTHPQCGNRWETTFRSIRGAGSGCPKCAYRRISESKILPESEFKNWLSENRPLSELIKYKSSSEEAIFKCLNPDHDGEDRIYRQVPEIMRLQNRGLHGCQACGWKENGKQFVIEEQEKRDWMEKNKPNIIMGDNYVDTKTPCTFTCKECDYSWDTTIAVFTNNDAGCPNCAGVARVTEEEFKRRLLNVSNGSIRLDDKYHGYGNKTWFRCLRNDCGFRWEIQPVRLTSSSPTGCPACTPTGFNPEKPAWFYLMHKSGEQQVGITNHPIQRISKHRRDGWSLLDIRGPGNGSNVMHYEKCIKIWLRNEIGLIKGKLENWSTINLEVSNIKDLAEASKTLDQLVLLE